MLKGEIIDLSSKNKYNISFFDDDSIESVRFKIGMMVNVHPDRLFILVGLKLPENYYIEDPRRWEKLFERMSYNGEKINQEIFSEYQTQYRTPETAVPFYSYDRVEWMSRPEALNPILRSAEFLEYRIFGVEEKKSFILPLTNNSPLTSRISAANIPIPENTKLFNSLYKKEHFIRFLVRSNAEGDLPIYYPLLRSNTLPNLSDEEVRLIEKNSKLLKSLTELNVPDEHSVSILRTRFYIPWVDTDFGENIRTRFEQIFYGLTVTENTPYIGLFTSKDQTSVHKFFTKDSKGKKPFVDINKWKSWWAVKPARNVKTLILFRGESNHHYDRIAITATDMVVSTYRPEDNDETIEQLKNQTHSWIKTLDAVMPFVVEEDIDKKRWELQDMSFVVKYSEKLDDFDLLRFGCVNSIFDMADKTKSQFSLLRSDHSVGGLSPVEVKIIQMLKESGGNLSPEAVSQELLISQQNANKLIGMVRSRLEDDPRLAERTFRGYPTLRVGPDFVVVSAVSDYEKSLQYANLLRFILSDPRSAELDEICPKKVEKVASASAEVSTSIDEEAVVAEEYLDYFADFEDEEEEASVSEETVDTSTGVDRISTDAKRKTLYRYFAERLRKFDPVTFNPLNSKYPKKCEQKHQPIILTTEEVQSLKDTDYKVTDYSKLELSEPEGTLICPEYWCMRDQIPIKESQLDKTNGEIKCPKCHGKLQIRSTDDPKEFPLVKRESGFVFPGITDYKSPHNDKHMPCCFKTDRSSKRKEQGNEDKYYILSEDKTLEEGRLSFLSRTLLDNLKIKQDYNAIGTRLTMKEGENSGFFRVGLESAAKNLRKFIGIDKKPPSPREALEVTLRCSFVNTWTALGSKHLDSITADLRKLSQFKQDDVLVNSLAQIISGIDEAYYENTLTELQELEYVAIAYQTDVFRIHLDTMELGCMFYTQIVRPRTRAVIILQNETDTDILAFTKRESRGFTFNSNVYSEPFTSDTYKILESLRNQSCLTKIPSYSDALNAIQLVLPIVEAEDYQIILDPYGKGQAFYIPGKAIIPFQSVLIRNVNQTMISGYKEITTENLPLHDDMISLLEKIKQSHSGFSFKESLYNNKNQKVELLLECGLRIPVQPIDAVGPGTSEVVETIREFGETELVFGKDSEELRTTQSEISYSAEIYEFLLFQLTTDLQMEDYRELRNTLNSIPLNPPEINELLGAWFNSITQFNDIREPKQFLSKIRKPCNEKCDGELCARDGDKCKVQINSTINKEKIYRKIFTTLIENSKIRSMILDGRSTPFFSTILYIQLPHEVIITDSELPE